MGTRLIALDLDGTLLNEKMHVSEKTRQVMELCAQRGIEIVPATGRALPAVPEEVLSLASTMAYLQMGRSSGISGKIPGCRKAA